MCGEWKPSKFNLFGVKNGVKIEALMLLMVLIRGRATEPATLKEVLLSENAYLCSGSK
jgi:hypothetical protein